MTKLLEFREMLQSFYGKYDLYIRHAIRFLVALTVFLVINGSVSYMDALKSPVTAIILGLICTFLPMNAIALFGALMILLHLYALSLEACVVCLLLLLLMFFMYFKLAPKNGYSAVLTPVLCCFRIPEIMPTAIGLYREPYSVLSMACGMILYYFLRGIKENESLLSASEEQDAISKFTAVLQPVIESQELKIMAGAFILTALLVYVIRRQSVKHAWSIAIGVGNVCNLGILLGGSFLTGNTKEILWIVLGTAAAVVVGLLMEFFLFHLDYTRTERVQFEDDEYYYYVKAVPKVFVPSKNKRVKQINKRKNTGISKKDLADEFEIDRELLDD